MNENQREQLAKGEDAASEQGEVLHGDKANPEVFEQPAQGETVELNPAGTVVAKEQAPDPLDSDNRDNA
jgi:hypothetical protein